MLEKDSIKTFEEKMKSFSMLNYDVLEGMADWVRVVDKSGIIIYANKTMKRDIGYDIVGKECYKVLGKDKPCKFCITERSIKTGEIAQKEEVVGDRIFSAKSSPVTDSQGNIYAAVEVFRDVTRERKLEKAIKSKNKRMQEDLCFAKTLQEKILPKKGIYKNIKIDYIYMPSELLSGDMFDVFYVDDENIGIYISDVVGHGITASMMTMFVRQTMRAVKDDIISPSKALSQLHKTFIDLNLDDDKYFTIFYGVINTNTKEFRYSNAGHNCVPILFNDKKIQLLKVRGYPISYIFDEIYYNEFRVFLNKGDKILFYTDGITEIKNKEKEEFGVKRVIQTIKEGDNSNIIKVLKENVCKFNCGKQEDDFAVVLMETLE